MNKKFLIIAAAVAVTIVIILIVIIVSSGKKEIVMEESTKNNEQETSTTILSTTTQRIVTYTEIYGPTTSDPEDDIPPGDHVKLNVRCLRRSGISLDSLRNIAYGNIGEDTSTKNYLLCVLKAMGILDRNENKIDLQVTESTFTTLEPSSVFGARQTNDDIYLNRLMKIRQTIMNSFNEVRTTNQDVEPKTDVERLRKIFSIMFSCVTQTGITQEEARQIRYGFIDENASSKEFIFCFLKKFGIVNEDGDMVNNTNALTKIWGQTGDNDKAETVIAACQDKKADTPTDTAVLVYKCIKGIK